MGTEITRYEPPSEIARFRPFPIKPEATAHPNWKNFVSQQSVRAITIAPKSNYLWLATWGGVIAYPQNDVSYKRYSSEHGLAGNEVSCLCLDKNENPWVGYSEGGLSYFDGQNWQVYRHLEKQVEKQAIRALAATENCGGIWVATGEMVYYVREFSQPPIPIPVETLSKNYVVDTNILLVNQEQLLIGNPWGLFSASVNQPPTPVATDDINDIKIKSCTALAKDQTGKIWIGTPEGLFFLEDNQINKWNQDFSPRILALAVTEKRLWILTAYGLFYILDGKFSQVNIPETRVNIRAIAASNNDNYLWVGTDKLLAKVEIKTSNQVYWDLEVLNPHPDDALSNFGRCAVYPSNSEKIWVGTASGLFTCKLNQEKEDKEDKFSQLNDFDYKDIRFLVQDNSNVNQMWMLTWPNGLKKLQLDIEVTENDFPQPANLPLLLTKSQDGYPYILTEEALLLLKAQQVTREEFQGLPPHVTCLHQTLDGVWWLGTAEGLYKLNNCKWQFVGEQPGPLQTTVYGMLTIKNTLCIGTESGLWVLQENHWVQHKLPISHPRVWALASSKQLQSLWLASEDGVINYNPFSRTIDENKFYNCINSGLASRRVTVLLETPQALWIITQAGISRVYFK
jgi:ligand-binding sensor domain-containing protein